MVMPGRSFTIENWSDQPITVTPFGRETVRLRSGEKCKHCAERREAKRTRAPNGSFDRKAYQRNLMRERRAADRLAKGK
jgi:hypothetical protein